MAEFTRKGDETLVYKKKERCYNKQDLKQTEILTAAAVIAV